MDDFHSSDFSSKGNNNFPFSCFNCKSKIATFKNGWKLNSGEFAILCDTCGSAYESRSFCLKFHGEEDGWTNCKHCEKMLHCGCIMSKEDIIIMDYGGVCCVDCRNKHVVVDTVNKLGNDKLSMSHGEPMLDVQLATLGSPKNSAMMDNSTANSSIPVKADKATGSSSEYKVYTRRKKLAKGNSK